jgi:hypothetical protein
MMYLLEQAQPLAKDVFFCSIFYYWYVWGRTYQLAWGFGSLVEVPRLIFRSITSLDLAMYLYNSLQCFGQNKHILWFHLIQLMCMRKNIPSTLRLCVLGWSARAVIWSQYFIRSSYVTIKVPMLYWLEQAQPLAEWYILWFHLILLICMRQNIPSP